MNPNASLKKSGIPLWPLALLCALLPILATHLSWIISVTQEYVPYCIPYIEGCTSISRAARNGLANHIFKIIMLPAAIIQLLTWIACYQWLKQKNIKARSLPLLGIIASVFLSLYVIFLGTEGEFYQTLRRYGINLYFEATYIAQLVLLYRIHSVAEGILPKIMLVLSLSIFPLGLIGLYLSVTTMDLPINDQIENIIEWNFSLLMIIWFFLLAAIWKKQKLRTETV